MIREIEEVEVHWVLRANDPKNPARVLDEIFQARKVEGEIEGREYEGCLFQVKDALEQMKRCNLVEALPKQDEGGCQEVDSYDLVYNYRLTAYGISDRPPYVCWGNGDSKL